METEVGVGGEGLQQRWTNKLLIQARPAVCTKNKTQRRYTVKRNTLTKLLESLVTDQPDELSGWSGGSVRLMDFIKISST